MDGGTYFDGPDGIKITTEELILGRWPADDAITAIPIEEIEYLAVYPTLDWKPGLGFLAGGLFFLYFFASGWVSYLFGLGLLAWGAFILGHPSQRLYKLFVSGGYVGVNRVPLYPLRKAFQGPNGRACIDQMVEAFKLAKLNAEKSNSPEFPHTTATPAQSPIAVAPSASHPVSSEGLAALITKAQAATKQTVRAASGALQNLIVHQKQVDTGPAAQAPAAKAPGDAATIDTRKSQESGGGLHGSKTEEAAMFCTNCGRGLVEGSHFCVYCGTAVEAALNYARKPAAKAAPELLPKVNAQLDELRQLVRAQPENAELRKRLAMGLFDAMSHSKAENQLDMRDVLLDELRQLSRDYPEDVKVRDALALGLVQTAKDATEEERRDLRDALRRHVKIS